MLEFLRKHQYGLMLVVAILTIIAFVFLYDKNTYGQGGGPRGTAFKIYGKGYDANQLQKLDNYFLLAQRLGMAQMAYELRGTRVVEGKPVDFPFNLMILRKEGRDLGISPSNEDVQKEVESMFVFQDPNTRKFDPARFKEVSESLTSRNFQNADINQIIKDKITLDKIKELLAANIQPPVTEVEDNYEKRNQKTTAYALMKKLEDYSKDVEVTDEEIKARFELEKDELLTEEKRELEYVIFQGPIFPKPEPPKTRPPNPLDNIGLTNPTGKPRSIVPGIGTGKKSEDDSEDEADEEENATEPEGDSGTEEATPEAEETPAPVTGSDADPAAADAELDASADDDPCGSPQDEPATDEEAAEVVEDGAKATSEAVEETAETAENAAKDLADDLVDALKEEGAEKAGGGEATAEKVEGNGAVSTAGENATAGSGEAEPARAKEEKPKVLSPDEKKAVEREYMKLTKEKIDAALGSTEEIDLEALGRDYLAATEGKYYSGSYGTVAAFAREDAPKFVTDARPSGQSPPLIDLIFAAKKGGLSQPTRIITDGREDWILFRVNDVIEPKQLTFEEAKEKIAEQLKDEKAEKAMLDALEEQAEKHQDRDGWQELLQGERRQTRDRVHPALQVQPHAATCRGRQLLRLRRPGLQDGPRRVQPSPRSPATRATWSTWPPRKSRTNRPPPRTRNSPSPSS